MSRVSGSVDIEGGALTLFRHITVAFLAIFGILLIMMLWAYTKVRAATPRV